MLSKKYKRQYLIAVYLIVFVSSISFYLWGTDSNTTLKDSALSLSIELFSVALVFFLVDFIFTIGDWDLSDRVADYLEELKKEDVSASDFFQENQDLEFHIKIAQQIDLCGVTLSTTINKKFVSLRQQIIDKGAKVRILIIGEASQILTMAANRSEDAGNPSYYRKRLATTLEDINYLKKYLKDAKENDEKKEHRIGTFEVRFLTYAPSFSVISFDPGNKNGVAFVEIYPHHTGYNKTPKFGLTKEKDGEWYQYFVNQFEAMWKAAIPWPSEETTIQTPSAIPFLDKARSKEFFLPEKHLTQDLFTQADEIYLSGYSLSRTIRDLTPVISDRLAEGASIKIMLVDPENNILMEQIAEESVAVTAEIWCNSIRATVSLLNAIAQNPNNKGILEIGFLPFTPSFGLKFIDPDLEWGIGFVEIYHHKTYRPNATFMVANQLDPQWYPFFKKQFELLWTTCRIQVIDKKADE